ncbi:ParA family protein [Pseudomonas putida]|uniref:ParA family protein n=1 Tax=Pseudomonas putida TaxID=303 RepID=A0A4D6XIX9_PSEPU|nr:ParA family protein [Pseudomonas putida]QCI14051.1 ParA family protein [Pseudomonas putida]
MTHPKKAKRAGQVSTKGGTGKSTGSTNLGAFTADAGLRTLLIDLDPVQPSASSYFPLEYTAPGGIFELLSYNETDPAKIISRTSIKNLDVIISNDANNQLNNLILQAPDGRLRLANLMSAFDADYDLILFDTQGARSAMLEMVVLASDIILSPLPPNMLAAREFSRGTIHMMDGLRSYARLGLTIPHINIIINGLDETADARAIHRTVREIFDGNPDYTVLQSIIPDAVIFKKAASQGVPAHRLEYRQPSNRKSPSALSVIRNLAIEAFPEWKDRFEAMTEERVAEIAKEARRDE